jgi:ligand-binding SRPBCC domain-containing protein
VSGAVTLSRAPDALPDSAYLRARPPRYALRTRTVIQRPLAEVFTFFSAAENLARITPPEMGFQILTTGPIAMRQGATIDYRIRVLVVPLRWRTVIDVWEPGRRFVDAQVRGPYACWWHEHAFDEEEGRTIMDDLVLYAPPLGPLGRLAQHVIVARQLRHIFSYRARTITRLYGA